MANYTDITPIMTSNTTPAGYVVSASSVNGNLAAWQAFDSVDTTATSERIWHSTGGVPQWIMMQFPEAVQVDMFSIKNRPDTGNAAAKGITAFQLQGSNNGSTFDTLGTYTSDGAIGATYEYTVTTPGKYKYYRVYITAAGYAFSGTPYVLIEQIRFYSLAGEKMGGKVNIGGVNRAFTEGYVNIGGVICRKTRGYVNIGGVTRMIWYREPTPTETQIGTLAVGSVVKIPVGGVTYEWIVVHQGLPSSTYEASCNGAWLLMKTVYSSATHSGYVMSSFDSTDNDYANSDANAWLNGTFFNLIDSSVRSLIKQVKIPYRPGTSGSSVNSGSNGLSAKIFFLSATELGITQSYVASIGSKLDYFPSTNNNSELRIAKNLSGGAMNWHTRSPYTYNTTNAIYIDTSGGMVNNSVISARAFRPALILPSTTLVDTDMNVLA